MNKLWEKTIHQEIQASDSLRPVADCACSTLPDMGLIRVTGTDARDFLQGQLTCDLNEVSPQHARIGAYCNPKGRVLALLLVLQRKGDLLLLLPRERLTPILKRLNLFILRSDVKMEDVSDLLIAVGLTGTCSSNLAPATPEVDFSCAAAGDFTCIRLPGSPSRVLMVSGPDALIDWWKKNSQQVDLVAENFWHLMDIRAGLPNVYDVTAEAFVPQMLNLQLLEGISFTKGCYTGQEVVARMKYLGQLKRRMYLARLDTDLQPEIGDALFSASSKSGQGAGRLVDVRPSPDGGYEALIVSQISSVEADDIQLKDSDGPKLHITAPPYGFSND